MNIGAYLRIARAKVDLGLREAARKLDVPKSNLEGWELGRGQPDDDELDRMVAVYGLSKGQLTGLQMLPEDMEDVVLPRALAEFIGKAWAEGMTLSEVAYLAAVGGDGSLGAAEGDPPGAWDAVVYLTTLTWLRTGENRDARTGQPLVAAGMSSDAGVGGTVAGVDRGDGEEVVAEEG